MVFLLRLSGCYFCLSMFFILFFNFIVLFLNARNEACKLRGSLWLFYTLSVWTDHTHPCSTVESSQAGPPHSLTLHSHQTFHQPYAHPKRVQHGAAWSGKPLTLLQLAFAGFCYVNHQDIGPAELLACFGSSVPLIVSVLSCDPSESRRKHHVSPTTETDLSSYYKNLTFEAKFDSCCIWEFLRLNSILW